MKTRIENFTNAWIASLLLTVTCLTGCESPAGPSPDTDDPGVAAKPVSLQLSESSIDFGQVPMTNEATYTINVVNVGAEHAELTGFEITEGSVASFVSVDKDPMILAAGESRDISFKFTPSSVATFNAIAKIQTPDGKQTWKVDLTGQSTPCFYLEQAAVSFLETTPACGFKTLTNKLFNKCNYMIHVNTAGISSNSPYAAFEVTPELRAGTIQPGTEIELTVKFDPSTLGDYLETWTLRSHPIQVGGVAESVQFDLRAKSSATISQTDSFTISQADMFMSSRHPGNLPYQLDFLIVLDTRAQAMSTLFAIQMGTLLTQLANDGYDLHVGFLAPYRAQFQCQPGSTRIGGALWPTDNSSPRILTPSMQDFSSLVYSRLTTIDRCTNYTDAHHGLEAATYALSSVGTLDTDQFIRSDAKLILMFLSPWNDLGRESPQAHANQIRLSKPNSDLISAFSATDINGPYALGSRYRDTVSALGGLNQPIDQLDIATLKTFVTQNSAPVTTTTNTKIQLTHSPIASSIVVQVNDAVNTSWTYDGAINSVIFSSPLTAGATVEVQYDVGCE